MMPIYELNSRQSLAEQIKKLKEQLTETKIQLVDARKLLDIDENDYQKLQKELAETREKWELDIKIISQLIQQKNAEMSHSIKRHAEELAEARAENTILKKCFGCNVKNSMFDDQTCERCGNFRLVGKEKSIVNSPAFIDGLNHVRDSLRGQKPSLKIPEFEEFDRNAHRYDDGDK